MSANAISKNELANAFQVFMQKGKTHAASVETAIISRDFISSQIAFLMGMMELKNIIDTTPELAAAINVITGQPWGIRTDKDKEGGGTGYPPAVVTGVVCESLISGLALIGNETNIIGGNQYTTQNGWAGKLERQKGISHVESHPGTLQDVKSREKTTKSGYKKTVFTAKVAARASCMCNGVFVEVAATEMPDMDARFELSAIGDAIDEVADNIKGKARARILEMLYRKCKGIPAEAAIAGSDRPDPIVIELAEQPVAKIESKPAAASDTWAVEYGRLTSPRAQDAWQYILGATEVGNIDLAEKSFGKLEASAKEKDSLKRFAEHRRDVLKGVA